MATSNLVVLLAAGACLLSLGVEGAKFTSVCPMIGLSNCVRCDGTRACLDLSSDRGSCGACFKACETGQVCTNGVCAAPPCGEPGTYCGDGKGCCAGSTCCGSTCTNTLNNVEHCGRCEGFCQPNQYCSSGNCVAGSGGSLAVNAQLGTYSTCDTFGDPLVIGARCLDNGSVSAAVLNISPDMFSRFGVGVYNSEFPRCLLVSTCAAHAPSNAPGNHIDLLWEKPANFTGGPGWLTCATRNCPDTGSSYSQIIVPNTGGGEVVRILSGNDTVGCVTGVTVVARVSMDCMLSSGLPMPQPLP